MEAIQDLNVWSRSKTFAVDIYKAFAACKDRGFKDQITRASVSIPSNIAEGYDRNSKKEFARYLNIAKGSCAEVRTQLYISEETGLIDEQDARKLTKESLEITKMLQGLINHCKKQINT